VFAGTGLASRAKLGGLVGSEYDAYHPETRGGPATVEVFAHSPLRCRGVPGYADFVYYTAPGGAGVIDTGTNGWVPNLGPSATGKVVARITQNILDAFAQGPAGAAHPATANLSTPGRAPTPPPGE
jgi:hypothetical protein